MAKLDPIHPDDDDETVREKVLAAVDPEHRDDMERTLAAPGYLDQLRHHAAQQTRELPRSALVNTAMIRVANEMRELDPEAREKAEEVWRNPAAVDELARILRKEGDASRRQPRRTRLAIWGLSTVIVCALGAALLISLGRRGVEPPVAQVSEQVPAPSALVPAPAVPVSSPPAAIELASTAVAPPEADHAAAPSSAAEPAVAPVRSTAQAPRSSSAPSATTRPPSSTAAPTPSTKASATPSVSPPASSSSGTLLTPGVVF